MSKKNNGLREFANFVLDSERRVLWYQSQPVNLALKEIELLCALTEKGGEVVSKHELIEKVWTDSYVEESNLTRHIYVLRKTLRKIGASDNLIQTVPQRGYRFTAPVRPIENDALVIEKYTDTETSIEIEETSETPDVKKHLFEPHVWGFSRWRIAVSVLTVLLIAVVGLAFYAYRNSAKKTPAADIRSIAVLPFQTIDGKPETAHQGLGMADVLITRLSGISGIIVRPTSAVIGLENTDSMAAGQKLKTDAVLEGTIYRAGEKIRVTARLVRSSDGTPVWTGQFEKSLLDEITVQNEIARQVTDALALNLSRNEQNNLKKRYTENADAFQLYQKGRIELNKRNHLSALEAEKLFRAAIEHDPHFALAYTGLADYFSFTNSPLESVYASQKALEIDPELAEAHASIGLYQMFQSWRFGEPQWREAEASFKRAIALNPNYTPARQWYATLLSIQGNPREAQAELRRALEINPFSHNLWSDLAEAHYFSGEYFEAEQYALKALEIQPDFIFANGHLRSIYRQTGDYEKAFEYERKLYSNMSSIQIKTEKYQQNVESQWQNSRQILEQKGYRAFLKSQIVTNMREGDSGSDYGNAQNYNFIGERENALDALEHAYETRAFMLVFVKADPIFKNLREEPRFQEILRKMALN